MSDLGDTDQPGEAGATRGTLRRTLEDGSTDAMIREEPLVIEVASQQVVTMRTPGDDLDLAVGFLLSEGVIQRAADVDGNDFRAGNPAELQADTLTLHIAESRAMVEGRLTRTHEIRSSCGICGLTDPDELLEELPPLLPGTPTLKRTAIPRLRERFESDQTLFRLTGACHGAEIFGPDGESWGRGEDVGRHNALDKAIGAAAHRGHDLAHGIVMLSGRAGFDLVFKCLRLRLGVILSVSAPSALSFDVCRAAGATLIGFVRRDRMVVYCAGGRLR